MNTIYGEYSSLLGLIVKLSSISYQFRGKLVQPLSNGVNSDFIKYLMPIRTYQSLHTPVHYTQKRKSSFLGRNIFIFAKNLNDTWFPILI